MHRTIVFAKSICLILIFIIIFTSSKHVVQCAILEQGNFINNLNKGLKIASDLLGISTAADVANLVTEAFSTNVFTNNSKLDYINRYPSNQQGDAKQNVQNTPFQNNNNNTTSNRKYSPYLQQFHQQVDENQTPNWNNSNLYQNLNPKLITNILRLVGFDIKKLGSLAVHIMIIIAQAVSKGILSIANGSKGNIEESTNGRILESDKTFDWLFRHPSINTHRLLDQAMDGTLSEKIIAMIANYEDHIGQTACLQLLICKCTPFIRGMQQSLSKWLVVKSEDHHNTVSRNNNPTNTSSHMYNVQNVLHNFNFPSLIVYLQHEKQCESNYTQYCNMSLSHTLI